MKSKRRALLLSVVVLTLTATGCGTTNQPASTDSTRVVLGGGTSTAQATPRELEKEPTATDPAPTATRPPRVPPTDTAPPPSPTTAVNVFEILQPVTYVPKFSNVLYAVGIIRYSGTETRANTQISVALTEESGKVLASSNAIFMPGIIKPNSNIPYKALFNTPPEKFDKIELNVKAEVLESSFMKGLLYGDFEVLEPSLIPAKTEFEYPKVVGRVKNIGTKKATLVQIVGVLYAEDGNVVDVNQTFVNIQDLDPGGDSPFELGFVGVGNGATFELFPSGHQVP